MNATNTTAAPIVNFLLHDGNAFEVLAGFLYAARRAGWTDEQLKEVTTKCMSGDNENLMFTLSQFAVPDDDTDAQYEVQMRDYVRKQVENVLAETGVAPKNVGVCIAIYENADGDLHGIATLASILDGTLLGIAGCYADEFDDPFELLELMASYLENYEFDTIDLFDDEVIPFVVAEGRSGLLIAESKQVARKPAGPGDLSSTVH